MAYDDILTHPHHVSRTHPPMSMHDRAAQFSPFAALVGYEEAIDQTARQTEEAWDPNTEKWGDDLPADEQTPP